MKIILVIPTLKQGGAERIMSILANTWSEQGHDVHLALLAGGEHFYSLEKNVRVYDFAFENKGKMQKVVSEVKVFFKLRSLLKSTQPDFVLSFMTKYNVFTLFASSFLNLRVFVSDRSNPRKKLPFSLEFMRKCTYGYAYGIISQTSLAKELLKKKTGNENIEVIFNPVKKVTFYSEIERDNIIINVGRMVPEKGQKYLLEAFSKIENNDWKLVILGDGPLRRELEQQAQKLNIKDKVQMPGSVIYVDEWLAKSSIFAFPSVSEGFPNALLEAMAAGLPCVSFDCDAGPRDIMKDGLNGCLVPVGNIDNFSEKLSNLMGNSDLRNSIGNEAIKISYDLEMSKITDKYLKFCLENK